MKEKILKYIQIWKDRCYKNDIPDNVPDEILYMCPSYKRIAICILSNDVSFKKLGFSQPKSEIYDAIKKQELKNRKYDK